jgi:hypothetical protein
MFRLSLYSTHTLQSLGRKEKEEEEEEGGVSFT